jgi:hypothetical protein
MAKRLMAALSVQLMIRYKEFRLSMQPLACAFWPTLMKWAEKCQSHIRSSHGLKVWWFAARKRLVIRRIARAKTWGQQQGRPWWPEWQRQRRAALQRLAPLFPWMAVPQGPPALLSIKSVNMQAFTCTGTIPVPKQVILFLSIVFFSFSFQDVFFLFFSLLKLY